MILPYNSPYFPIIDIKSRQMENGKFIQNIPNKWLQICITLLGMNPVASPVGPTSNTISEEEISSCKVRLESITHNFSLLQSIFLLE